MHALARLNRHPFAMAAFLALVVAGAMYAADVATDRTYVVAVVSPAPLLRYPPHEYPQSNPTLATLRTSESLRVFRVRYGKDFEALQVERSSGEIGWVLAGGSIEVVSRGGER